MSLADYRRFLESYEPDDVLVFFLRNRHKIITGEDGKPRPWTLQHTTPWAEARTARFHSFLTHHNHEGADVYIGMNPVRSAARNRTKSDISCVRHLYLDFDENGDTRLDNLLNHPFIRTPHLILQTSQSKWQVIWSVSGFTPDLAEGTHRALVAHFGADPAAIDIARVLRVPMFYNHKYQPPFFVSLMRHEGPRLRPADFAAFPPLAESTTTYQPGKRRTIQRSQGPSQSERDWAWTLEKLKEGVSPETIVAELAARRHDKPSPLYYAKHTVTRAELELSTRAHTASSKRGIRCMSTR